MSDRGTVPEGFSSWEDFDAHQADLLARARAQAAGEPAPARARAPRGPSPSKALRRRAKGLMYAHLSVFTEDLGTDTLEELGCSRTMAAALQGEVSAELRRRAQRLLDGDWSAPGGSGQIR